MNAGGVYPRITAPLLDNRDGAAYQLLSMKLDDAASARHEPGRGGGPTEPVYASVSIEDLSIIKWEWALLHQEELRVVWLQSRSMVPLDKIDPLT
jgi:hypothetical protein